MIRNIMFLVIITAVAGFLTISCKQDTGEDTKVETENTVTADTDTKEAPADTDAAQTPADTGGDEDKPADSEPAVPKDAGKQPAADTSGDDTTPARRREWKRPDREAKNARTREHNARMLEQSKEMVDKDLSDGVFSKIDTSGDTVNAYVGDKFHDMEKRPQYFKVRNLYNYYTETNPEIKILKVYDEQTGREIIEVTSEGIKNIKK